MSFVFDSRFNLINKSAGMAKISLENTYKSWKQMSDEFDKNKERLLSLPLLDS